MTSSQTTWVCQPWFYEGEGYDDEPGTPDLIEAESAEEARAKFPAHKYTALNGVSVMTPAEWFERGGYDLEGLERPS